jgi:hypothetical protein
MISPRLIAALAASSLLLSGCAAGGNAPTRLIKQVTDGVEADIEDIKIRNVAVVAIPDGTATLLAYLVNWSDTSDQLVAVTINGVRVALTGVNILEKNKPIIFEGEAANAKGKAPVLTVAPGYRTEVVFYFRDAGKVELDALVLSNTGIYSSIL